MRTGKNKLPTMSELLNRGSVDNTRVNPNRLPAQPTLTYYEQEELKRNEARARAEQTQKLKRVNTRKQAVKSIDKEESFTFPDGSTKTPSQMNARERAYVQGIALEQRFRLDPNDENIIDEFVNPLTFAGSLAGGLAEAPYESEKSESMLPYAQAIGMPLLAGALGFDPLGSSLKKLPKGTTLNPWDKGFYRIVDEAGYNDALATQTVRARPQLSADNMSINGRPTSFPSFANDRPDPNYFPKQGDPYIFHTNTPLYRRGDINPVTGNKIRGSHWAYRPIDPNTGQAAESIPLNQTSIYTKNPLIGYNNITPYQAQSPNHLNYNLYPTNLINENDPNNFEMNKPKFGKGGKYTPQTLSNEKRSTWNKFQRFLQEQGVAGDARLNKGADQTAALLEQYRQINPEFDMNENDVRNVQWEMLQFQQNNKFPDSSVDVRSQLPRYSQLFDQKTISNVDGRIGSRTSQEHYPEASIEYINRNAQGQQDYQQRIDYGTNMDAYSQHQGMRWPKPGNVSSTQAQPAVYKAPTSANTDREANMSTVAQGKRIRGANGQILGSIDNNGTFMPVSDFAHLSKSNQDILSNRQQLEQFIYANDANAENVTYPQNMFGSASVGRPSSTKMDKGGPLPQNRFAMYFNNPNWNNTANQMYQAQSIFDTAVTGVTDYVTNRNNRKSTDKMMQENGMSDNVFSTVPNAGAHGDYGNTGGAYGQFRPDRLNAGSPAGMYNDFYRASYASGGSVIPKQLNYTPIAGPSAYFNNMTMQTQHPQQMGPVQNNHPGNPTYETHTNYKRGNANPNENAEKAYNYYLQKGLKPHVAAGIVGNLYQESTMDSGIINGIGAFGLAQWLGPRRKGLETWAHNKGINPSDFYAQLDYVLVEPGEGKRVLKLLDKTSTPAQAAVTFANKFERMGRDEAHYGTRIGIAEKLFGKRSTFKEGGEYELTMDEINQIMMNGGEVEFL